MGKAAFVATKNGKWQLLPFAIIQLKQMSETQNIVECCTHGKRYPAFVCQHLNIHTPVGFYEPFDSDPDKTYANDELNAWCDACDEVLWEAGEWNEETEAFASIKLVCDKCFFKMKELNQDYQPNLSSS